MANIQNASGTRCLSHPDDMAIDRCKSCRRPLCKVCAKKLPGGVFCSTACAEKSKQHQQRFSDMKRRDEEDARATSRRVWRSRLIMLVLLLVVVGGLALWLKTTNSAWAAERFPFLVPLLQQLRLMP